MSLRNRLTVGAVTLAALFLVTRSTEGPEVSPAAEPRPDAVPDVEPVPMPAPAATVGEADTTETAPERATRTAAYERAYIATERMVRVAAEEAEALADSVGARLIAPTGRSGLAVFEWENALAADEGTALLGVRARPMGRFYAATSYTIMPVDDGSSTGGGNGIDDPYTIEPILLYPAIDDTFVAASSSYLLANLTAPYPAPWQLDAMNLPTSVPNIDVGVAVLDSGVCTYARRNRDCTTPQALVSTSWTGAYDAFDGSSSALDDNGHGTAVAATLMGEGVLGGPAPDATLIPIKVLDANNQGREWTLIEGILEAAASRHVDIINMSLAAPVSYTPSREMLDAIATAHDAGVLMVAAAGNGASDRIAWPAASPLVMAVGASTPAGGQDGMGLAPYSNVGFGLDVLAPGGVLDVDADGNGHIDGILTETIDPTDHRSTTLVWTAGTSQAAALVSGTAAFLVGQGMTADQARVAMVSSASSGGWSDASVSDARVGHLDAATAMEVAPAAPVTFEGSLVPFLSTNGSASQVKVSALVAVERTSAGDGPVSVLVESSGASHDRMSCEIPAGESHCIATASTWRDPSVRGAWTVSLQGVRDHATGVVHRARPTMYLPPGLSRILSDVEGRGVRTTESSLALRISGDDALLGNTFDAYAVFDVGAGRATAPSALLVTADKAERHISGSEGMWIYGDDALLGASAGEAAVEKLLVTWRGRDYAMNTARFVALHAQRLADGPHPVRPQDFVEPGPGRAKVDLADTMVGMSLHGDDFLLGLSGDDALLGVSGDDALLGNTANLLDAGADLANDN